MTTTISSASTADLLSRLDAIEKESYALSYALSQISFAGETQDPPAASTDRAEALGVLYGLSHNLLCSDECRDLLLELSRRSDELEEWRADQVRVLKRDYDQAVDIPADEYSAFARLTCEASDVWHEAKNNNDWDAFAPYLDQIVETLVRFAHYKQADKDPYDVFLDEFEPGTSRAFYDAFFAELKATILPLVAAIQEKGWQPSRACLEGSFDRDAQFALTRELAQFEGLRMDGLVIEESLHPFTNSVSPNHAFITTHVYEDNMISNIYSTLHEGGHALYEMGVDQGFNYTSLCGGTSMGIHESISRFYENIIGRNKAFTPHVLRMAQKHFPEQLGNVDEQSWYEAINIAEPSLIRTEADELTYALHVVIRYEIEQDLFDGKITAAEVPALWAAKYKEYLGVDVPNHAEGALQDTHWSGGALGYFPTYALGSALGAQYVATMRKEGMDFEGLLAAGDLAPISAWLEERIWRYGRSKDPQVLVEKACGEPFNPAYFCDYLTQKYSELYNL